MQNTLDYTNPSMSVPSVRLHRGKRAFVCTTSRIHHLAGCLVVICLAAPLIARSECREGCGFFPSNTFLGDDALLNNIDAVNNTAVGQDALSRLEHGLDNTAVGVQALALSTNASENTAIGSFALEGNEIGNYNTAIGSGALTLNTTGEQNTATGYTALNANMTGHDNTANGSEALQRNQTGNWNTAVGSHALSTSVSGSSNTAVGYNALFSNSGNLNTADGVQALYSNTTGQANTATGSDALYSNTTGGDNTATGFSAMYRNTTGKFNTAIGYNALLANSEGSNNVSVGFKALSKNTTGGSNIAMGDSAGQNLTSGDHNIDIGNQGLAGDSAIIRIGTSGNQTATYIAGIDGAPIGSAVAVRINSSGQLGTTVSSARFKENIKPMKEASESIFKLEPVTFRYKHALSPEGVLEFGLVAEQVERVNPDLIVRDKQGKPYSVRYDAVNAMLLNEFLKAHRKLEEQTRINQEQEVMITRLEAMLKSKRSKSRK